MAVFEDKPDLQNLIDLVLSDAGHEITAVADSREAAFEVLHQIKIGNTECDVVILDGNLCSSRNCGSDANEIVDYITDNNIDVKVIGFSGTPMIEYDIPVDGEVKSKLAHELPRAIGALVVNSERRERSNEYVLRPNQSVLATG